MGITYVLDESRAHAPAQRSVRGPRSDHHTRPSRPVDARVLALQRTAGNAAVTDLLGRAAMPNRAGARGGASPVVQRAGADQEHDKDSDSEFYSMLTAGAETMLGSQAPAQQDSDEQFYSMLKAGAKTMLAPPGPSQNQSADGEVEEAAGPARGTLNASAAVKDLGGPGRVGKAATSSATAAGSLESHRATISGVAKSVANAKALAEAHNKDGDLSARAYAAAEAEAVANLKAEIRAGTFHSEAELDAAIRTVAQACAEAKAGMLRNAQGNARNVRAATSADVAAGIEGHLKGALKAEWGAFSATVENYVKGELKGNAGIGGGLHAGTLGMGGEGHAGAQTAAQVVVGSKGNLQFGDGGTELEVAGGADAFAKANSEGKFEVTRSGVELEGEALVGVGAGIKGTGQVGATLYNRKFFAVQGTVGAHVGYVYGAKGGFRARGGKLRFSLGGTGSAMLPAGMTAEMAPRMDFNPVLVFAKRQAYGVRWWMKPSETKDLRLANPGSAEQDLRGEFQRYSTDKLNRLETRTADEYVKIEKVQQIVNKYFPIRLITDHTQYDDIDAVIKRAIEAVLKPEPGYEHVNAIVKKGRVTGIEHLFAYGPVGPGSQQTGVGGMLVASTNDTNVASPQGKLPGTELGSQGAE